MFLRRVATSVLVVTVLSLIGFLGNNTVLTKDRHELAYNSRNLVRLHVLAHSNRPEDQGIKLKVRDAVLRETRRLFLGVRDPREAVLLARGSRANLAAFATRMARTAGASYDARVEVGRFPFPTKSYPFGTLPAGEYEAVRVILGDGVGANWWCVLFPPLCFLTPEGESISGPGRLRLLFLEDLLRKNGQTLDSFWRGWARFWGF